MADAACFDSLLRVMALWTDARPALLVVSRIFLLPLYFHDKTVLSTTFCLKNVNRNKHHYSMRTKKGLSCDNMSWILQQAPRLFSVSLVFGFSCSSHGFCFQKCFASARKMLLLKIFPIWLEAGWFEPRTNPSLWLKIEFSHSLGSVVSKAEKNAYSNAYRNVNNK